MVRKDSLKLVDNISFLEKHINCSVDNGGKICEPKKKEKQLFEYEIQLSKFIGLE